MMGSHLSVVTVQLFHLSPALHWRWHRIRAAITPGVTSRDTAQGEPGTTEAAMNGEGFQCIGRTTWVKATTASTSTTQRVQEGRDQPSVEMDGNAE